VQSFESAWLDWTRDHFASDLLVGSGGRVRLLAGPPMQAALGAAIAAIPGVASVEPYRVLSIELGDRPVFLQGVSVADRLAHGGLPMVEGDFAAAAAGLEAGTDVLLSDNLAVRLQRHAGDAIELQTARGPHRFRIAGTYVDYLGSLDLGAVVVAQSQLTALWNDRLANMFRVWLAPGASSAAVRSAILQRLPAVDGYYVVTARDFLDGVRAVLDRFFVAAWGLEIVAALVGVIGVVNVQLATVLDRAAELATLRTIGLADTDVTRSVMLECGALGLLGGLCGIAVGTMQGAQMMSVTLPLMAGWRIPLLVPALPLCAAGALAAIVSAAAGYVPARAAAGFDAGLRSAD
jgi:putative ABC transport system permease protein